MVTQQIKKKHDISKWTNIKSRETEERSGRRGKAGLT